MQKYELAVTDIHGEVMSDIGIQQGYPLSPTLFGLYIGELQT